MQRDSLKSVTRIVVKLGTGVLTDPRKLIDPAQLEQLVAQMAALRKAGKEVVLVTSGAVGAGMGALGYESRPTELAEKQACAAVGQSRLMAVYDKLFGYDATKRHFVPRQYAYEGPVPRPGGKLGDSLRKALVAHGCAKTEVIDSPILGAEGNREFLLYARRGGV